MTYVCEICRGSRIIRLPVHSRLSVYAPITDRITELSHKDFPCPACADITSIDHVAIIKVESKGVAPWRGEAINPQLFQYVVEAAISEIGESLKNSGIIKTERGQDNLRDMTFSVTATLGVVSPTVVASMKERIAKNQAVGGEGMMVKLLDSTITWSTDGPICPECRTEYVTDEAFYFDQSGYTIECDCGAAFTVQPDCSWTWTARRIASAREILMASSPAWPRMEER